MPISGTKLIEMSQKQIAEIFQARNTLKKCPFCGANENVTVIYTTVEFGNSWTYVLCRDCQAQGPTRISEKKAIQDWNATSNRMSPQLSFSF